MSKVEDLARAVNDLAAETEREAAALANSLRTLEDHADRLRGELESSQTGGEVNRAFGAASQSVGEAINQLQRASQMATDYAASVLAG
jgi:ABC-type transporter Mla subunit MlaD